MSQWITRTRAARLNGAHSERLSNAFRSSGWALAYGRYGTQSVPRERETLAKRGGMWRGQFTPP